MAGIWVLVEHFRGEVQEITYEMLGAGRELADQLRIPLQAVVLGHGGEGLCQSLGAADSVLAVEVPSGRELIPEGCVQVLGPLLQERTPKALLIGNTNVGLGLGSLLSATLSLPFVNFCRALSVRHGRIVATSVLYGGKIEAEVSPAGEPAIYGISPGICPAERGRSDRSPPIERIPAPPLGESRVEFKAYMEPEPGDIDITKMNVLVAVGRGIQRQENVALAEELAQVLGGAVCASRPVVDQGWLPLSRQVGRSGVRVKPKLYLAAGISGAPEHVEGMKQAALIIAINTDPGAPIFHVAHYGIVGDAVEILPALTAAVRERRR
jgi:electron transfer flavoprotein alpha subunit